jgi:SET domain-containing protein
MIPQKKKVIRILNKTYCRLRPSAIGGVGVFAIRDIPKNIDPFPGIHNHSWYKISTSDLKGADPEILKMVDDFYVIEKDGSILVPSCGLNGMDISYFLNHSQNPNMVRKENGSFKTSKVIKKGKELLVSYGTYDHKWKK